MGRTFAAIAFLALNSSMSPAIASECTLHKDIDATRSRWSTLRSEPTSTSDNAKVCRAYATSFYEAVTLRQAAAGCDRERSVSLLDAEIEVFNDLLATKCSN
jgi:hypothetical protein